MLTNGVLSVTLNSCGKLVPIIGLLCRHLYRIPMPRQAMRLPAIWTATWCTPASSLILTYSTLA